MRRVGIGHIAGVTAIAVGGAVVSLPILIAWLVGSSTRRLWVIAGPRPFSLLGSGPLLVRIAVGCISVGLSLIWIGHRAITDSKGVEG